MLRKNHFFLGYWCFYTVFDRWSLSTWLKIRTSLLTWPKLKKWGQNKKNVKKIWGYLKGIVGQICPTPIFLPNIYLIKTFFNSFTPKYSFSIYIRNIHMGLEISIPSEKWKKCVSRMCWANLPNDSQIGLILMVAHAALCC